MCPTNRKNQTAPIPGLLDMSHQCISGRHTWSSEHEALRCCNGWVPVLVPRFKVADVGRCRWSTTRLMRCEKLTYGLPDQSGSVALLTSNWRQDA